MAHKLLFIGRRRRRTTDMPHVNGDDDDVGYGVSGYSSHGGYGVVGRSERGIAVDGESYSGIGVLGSSTNYMGVCGESFSDYGVYGESVSSIGVYGESFSDYGVYGYSDISAGVYGESFGGYGVYGYCERGIAVDGESKFGEGVVGTSESGIGVVGSSSNYMGVIGESSSSIGVYGSSYSSYAAYLDGRVYIKGPLSKPGGSFKIDHPLDPANKYLHHSFVESPDMKNVYDGVVTLERKGEAEIELPDWFGVLNKDFRYQLTAIGAPGPNLYVAEEISDTSTNPSRRRKKNNRSRFKIAGGKSGMKVSWQVTGIRKDPWAEAHRIQVEEDKPDNERGYYLHPDLYDQPADKGISRLLVPEEMLARITRLRK